MDDESFQDKVLTLMSLMVFLMVLIVALEVAIFLAIKGG